MQELLLHRPGNPAYVLNHKQGIPNVGNLLRDQAAKRRRIIAMVDCDKHFTDHVHLRLFGDPVRISKYTPTHHFLAHPQLPEQQLIVLNPACDAWLFKNGVEVGFDFEAHGLPTDILDFARYCKKNGATEIPQLRALLEAIRRAYPPLYQELAEFVASVWPPAQTR